jgi:hypothetical protein
MTRTNREKVTDCDRCEGCALRHVNSQSQSHSQSHSQRLLVPTRLNHNRCYVRSSIVSSDCSLKSMYGLSLITATF